MTPTICLCITALCAIAGLVGTIVYRGVSAGKAYGELTSVVRDLTESFKEFKELFKAHTGDLGEHEGRLAKLEFILDVDGKSMGIVQDIAEIHRRRRQRRGGQGGQDA